MSVMPYGADYDDDGNRTDAVDIHDRQHGDPDVPWPSGSRSTTKEERSKPVPPDVPVPDRGMFAGLLGEIVWAADPTTEADPVGVYASLQAAVGVAIGGEPYIQVGNTRHPLLIWPLLFGRTGSGRKGDATETGTVFFRNAAPDSAGYTVTGLSSGEGLIERLRDPGDENDGGGTHDKRLLVIEPEFGSVMARSKRDGSTLAAVQREAWDGKPLSVLNRKAVTGSASHVAVIGHITPREFRIRLAETEMAGGTYNRYLPLYVERSKRLPIPDGVSWEIVSDLGGKLAESITAARGAGRINLSQDAAKLWSDELYDEMTAADEEDHAWTEFMRRAAPYCLRIAALATVLDGRRLVTRPDLTAAAAQVRYAIASAHYVLDRQARDPRLDRLQRAIDAAGESGPDTNRDHRPVLAEPAREASRRASRQLCWRPGSTKKAGGRHAAGQRKPTAG